MPFVINHFDEVVTVDMRYFRSSPTELIDEYEITDVLFLYNIETFAEDTNLIYLMK